MSDAPPPLLKRARGEAARLGFERSCIDEVGRLLAVLVAGRPGGRIAEAGTGTGVGAAWIASALTAGATLVTVESDAARAEAAATLFAETSNVEVLHGDWHGLLVARAPFDLLFLDAGGAKQVPEREVPPALALLAHSGTIVFDDLTPGRAFRDPFREFLAAREDLISVEILTTPTTAAIVATKTR